MAIGYSLRMCAQNVDSTNPGRSNLVFRSKPIAKAEMSNRLISALKDILTYLLFKHCHLSNKHKMHNNSINQILCSFPSRSLPRGAQNPAHVEKKSWEGGGIKNRHRLGGALDNY